MKRVPPPPTDEAPVSSEIVVEIVKKRLAAPRDPPPSGMASFKPKSITGHGRLDFDDRPDPKHNHGYDRDRYDVAEEDAPSAYDHRHDAKRDHHQDRDQHRGRTTFDDDDHDRYNDSRAGRDRDNKDTHRSNGHDNHNNNNHSDDHNHNQADWRHNGHRDEFDEQPRELSKPRYTAEPKVPDAVAVQQNGAKQVKGLADVPSMDSYDGQAKVQRLIPFDFTHVLNSTYRDLRDFVLSPVNPGTVVRCYIERNRSGMNMLFPVFTLCADLEDGTGRELMACRKVASSLTSHYVFSLKNEDLYRPREQRSRLYLGKLRHVSATEYVLFDDGICKPNAKNSEDAVDEEDEDDTNTPGAGAKAQAKSSSSAAGRNHPDDTLYRQELAVICFNANTRPVPIGVRGCEVGIPAVPSGFAASTEESAAHFGRNHTGIITSFRKSQQSGLQNAPHYRKCFIMHEKASKSVGLDELTFVSL
jgi:hypothetical protein